MRVWRVNDLHQSTPRGRQKCRLADLRNQAESVLSDVLRIRAHPLVPASVPVYGYINDVKNGRLVEVPEASKAGRAA
jgi:hypothetical protein